jgi:tRNA dimethylallyltransferase
MGPAAPQDVVFAIFGPTGVGKTAVALALAERIRAQGRDPVAISADALQVYEGLATLTGSADESERQVLEHRLLGFVPVTQEFSVGRFAALAHEEIDAALGARRVPVVVGGTGLYLRAALTDLELRPPPPAELRGRLVAEMETLGAPAMHARLAGLDEGAAAGVDPGDRSRIIRRLELIEMGEDPEPAGEELWTPDVRHPTVLAGLVMDRDRLYEQIDARVDAMVAAGAGAEVRAAEAAGASPTARMALGYRELLEGDVPAMKLRTRRYAKRQLTWMRKLAGLRPIDVTGRDAAEVAGEILGLEPVRAR